MKFCSSHATLEGILMKNLTRFLGIPLFGVPLLLTVLAPHAAHGCACGCGVFDVGTSSMLPSRSGGMVFLNYDYQNQSQDWGETSRAPADSNDDKDLETHFVTLGVQYMFNRSWGLQVQVPYWYRHFATDTATNDLATVNFGRLGDIRIKGEYTGFSEDLSSGVTFGVKLPTGSYSYDSAVVDRDSQIGSGSTDILLGGFYRQALIPGNSWSAMAIAELDAPFLSLGGYKPGAEIDESVGVNYNDLSLGGVQIKPLAQIIGSERARDTGPWAANPVASGYARIFLSPGVELHLHPVSLYGDVEFPVYQNMNGYQLVAPILVKVSLSSMF